MSRVYAINYKRGKTKVQLKKRIVRRQTQPINKIDKGIKYILWGLISGQKGIFRVVPDDM